MVEADEPQPYAAANARIARVIAALPDYDTPKFWTDAQASLATIPSEVLVHILREFRARNRTEDVNHAADLLIQRAYGIAKAIFAKRMPSRPGDHEDAIRHVFMVMWHEIVRGDSFWERNFLGALESKCRSACRTYLATKRSDKPAADFDDRAKVEAIIYSGHPGASADAASTQTALHNVMYEQALATLESSQRAVWKLIFEEELTQRDAATRLDLSINQVRDRLTKAKERLGAFYSEGELYEHGT